MSVSIGASIKHAEKRKNSMKVAHSLVALMMLLELFVWSQPVPAVSFAIGARGGLALSNYWGDDADSPDDTLGGYVNVDRKPRVGFSGGAFFAFELAEYLSIEPEVLFSTKGRHVEGSYSITVPLLGVISGNAEVTEKLNYLDLPVSFKIIAPLDGGIQPYFYAGPLFSFLISAEIEQNIDASSYSQDTVVDIEDDLDHFDMGMVMGGGVRFEAGPGDFILDFRFAPGFFTIDEEDNNGDQSDINNWMIVFSAGYAFRF